MKLNRVLAIVMLFVIIMSLCGCGDNSNKETPAEAFFNRVKTITAENTELAGYSISEFIDQGSGLYAANAIVNGETIGAVSVKFEGEEITEIIISFAAEGPVQKEYQQPIIASAMALDVGFEYSDVDGLMEKLSDMLIFGGDAERINGYTYSSLWDEDDQIYVKFTK